MPQDRLFHPRLGHSEKITMLTDFEFRVWNSYILTADDFGVMRASAVTLQSTNDALDAKPARIVMRALERLLVVALVQGFEHQGRSYVFQRDWQHYQKIEWPRNTIEPAPAQDILDTLTSEKERTTRDLFGRHPGGTSRKKAKDVPNDLERDSQIISDSRAPARGERLTLTANAQANGQRLREAVAPAEVLLDAYRAHWKRAYGHESSLLISPIEQMKLEQQIEGHKVEQLLAALAAYFDTTEVFVVKAKHPLPLFLRDPLRFLAVEATHSSPEDDAAQLLADIRRQNARVKA